MVDLRVGREVDKPSPTVSRASITTSIPIYEALRLLKRRKSSARESMTLSEKVMFLPDLG